MPTRIQLFFVWVLPVPVAALIVERNSTNSTAQEKYAMVTEVAQKFKGKYYIAFSDTADAAFEKLGVTEFPFIASSRNLMSARKIAKFIEDVDTGQVEHVARRLQGQKHRRRVSGSHMGRRRGVRCTPQDENRGENEKGKRCEEIPKTQKGCKCRKATISEQVNTEGNDRCDYCCNPDGRTGGPWCFVEFLGCEGNESGTCDQGDQAGVTDPGASTPKNPGASTPKTEEGFLEEGGGAVGGLAGVLVLLCCCYWAHKKDLLPCSRRNHVEALRCDNITPR